MIRILSLICLFAVSVTSSAEVGLKFGRYTSDKPAAMVKQFRLMLSTLGRRLEELLGEPVKIRIDVAKDYTSGLQRLVNGDVDFARFGPASYVAVRVLDPSVDVLAMESRYGGRTFYGVICVKEDSPVQQISDLRGKRFSFGSERSTIGRHLTQKLLIDNKIISSGLKQFAYLGRHDKVAAAVVVG